jgi:hypothetical protein
MFINISPDCRIEIYYMNQEQCNNYNAYHCLSEQKVSPGYYYDDMNGPFSTKQGAIEAAKKWHLSAMVD